MFPAPTTPRRIRSLWPDMGVMLEALSGTPPRGPSTGTRFAGGGEHQVTVTTTGTDTGHPLAALTADEILAATAIVRADPRWTESWRFAYVGLEAPPKASVRGFTAGDPVDRLVRMQIVAGPEAHVIEMVVSVTTGEVRSYVEGEGMRPGLLF